MKTVVIYSGGLDSSVLIYFLLAQGYEVKAISFNYGQKQQEELKYAQAITKKLKVEHRVIDLTSIQSLFGSCGLTDEETDVAKGTYNLNTLKANVVPNRNMIMLSIAGAWAISEEYNHVAYAGHSGDHELYPDCRVEFVSAMDQALKLADWHKISLLAPFAKKTKTEILKLGHELGVPFDETWSCYESGSKHCAECPTCLERQTAFLEAGYSDPTIYLK